MNEIIIDYDNLEVINNELKELKEDYQKNLSKINQEIKNIQEENIWIGIDYNQFIDSNDKYMPYLNRIEKLLNYYQEFLKNVNTIYQELEEDYSKGNIDE